jgi:hypothetical protein
MFRNPAKVRLLIWLFMLGLGIAARPFLLPHHESKEMGIQESLIPPHARVRSEEVTVKPDQKLKILNEDGKSIFEANPSGNLHLTSWEDDQPKCQGFAHTKIERGTVDCTWRELHQLLTFVDKNGRKIQVSDPAGFSLIRSQ